MAGKEIGDHFGLLDASTSRIIKERGALMWHVEIQDLTPLSGYFMRKNASDPPSGQNITDRRDVPWAQEIFGRER
jgi:hypothetical protein